MVSYRKLALVLLCVGSLFVTVAALKEKKASALERLLSKDGIEIKEAQNQLLAARKDLIARLISIIEDKENRVKGQASVRAAIFLLGEMRSVEAIEALVEHIGFPFVYEGEPMIVDIEGGMIHRGLKGIGKTYPAVSALIKIGEPCLDDVITKISSTDHVSEEKACLGMLVGLRQRDFVIGMLKDAIKKKTDTKKKDRLQSSLDLLMQIKE